MGSPSRRPTLVGARRTVRWVWQHPSNRDERLRRLLLLGRLQLTSRVRGGSCTVRYGSHSHLRCRLDQASSKRAAYYRVPDWPEMLVWQELLIPGALFVDVGANVGLYTVWALDLGADVVAVEPVAASREQLEENVALNHGSVDIRATALGASDGWAHMDGADLNRQHLDLDGPENDHGDRTGRVRVETLDAVLGDRSAVGVKIDVEGAERLVLEGGARALAEGRIATLQLEWNEASQWLMGETRRPVADLLRDHGYALSRPDERGVLVRDDDLADSFGRDVFATPDTGRA